MTNLELSENGNTAFEKILGHNPEILKRWDALEQTLWQNSILPADLLEQVRRTTAFKNGCEYCMVKAGKPNFTAEQQNISLAAGFAELFAISPKDITAAHFSVLKQNFTTQQIAALCAFVAFVDASQKLGRLFNLTADLQQNAQVTLSEL
ncbi:carboxymuconolactone decarboxylase family protein [Flavobacterium agricola]|uniref:Carboxymuconolactone decarboxylase family protein n=1 Tax=Flavobacterium agricola TaxID=2870839 RepID=A0ABY6LWJ3_9FLAO|nr:carboxymuconolactone decarboxylase family protein [Flavobacterium agricola]UYW00697.1 carboxymuconolactone decarboxylase family protein [Flavobacterium agricola]